MCLGLSFRSAVVFHCSVRCIYFDRANLDAILLPPVFGIARRSWLVLFLRAASRGLSCHSVTTKVCLFIVRVGVEVPPHLSLDYYYVLLFVPSPPPLISLVLFLLVRL